MVVVIDSSIPRRVAHLQPVWRKCMTTTIRPVRTMVLIGLSETNTIGYYGVQAVKTFAKVKVVIQAALAKVEGVVKGAVKIITRLTYRQRYAQSTGRDPCICPHCQSEMGVWRIWHPTYGVIYDEGEVIKRGTYASS